MMNATRYLFWLTRTLTLNTTALLYKIVMDIKHVAYKVRQ
jgi:hypothetical protein